jgi:hypothetical protein
MAVQYLGLSSSFKIDAEAGRAGQRKQMPRSASTWNEAQFMPTGVELRRVPVNAVSPCLR